MQEQREIGRGQADAESRKQYCVQITTREGDLVVFAVYPAADQSAAVTAALVECGGEIPEGCQVLSWASERHLVAVPQDGFVR